MTRKICSLIIMAILLVPAFVFADEAVLNHPIFNEKNWTYSQTENQYSKDPDGSDVLVIESKFYDGSVIEYGKSEHTIFGELVLRIYGVFDSTGVKLLERWIQVEKDGKWHTVKDVDPEIIAYPDQAGKIEKVVITLKDKNGNEIVRREVKRKDITPAAISEEEKALIDKWIQDSGLNKYGDLQDRMYMGGTPLFDEKTGQRTDRYDYILKNHPDRPWLKNQK